MSPSSKRVHWPSPAKLNHVLHIDRNCRKASDEYFLTSQDQQRIERDNRLTLDLMEADLFVETQTRCRRGLECKTTVGQAKCEDRRRKVRRAVLEEQQFQKTSQVVCDFEALAKASRRESHVSRFDAYVVGVSDSNISRMLEATELQNLSLEKHVPSVLAPADEPLLLIVLEQQQESYRNQNHTRFPSVA